MPKIKNKPEQEEISLDDTLNLLKRAQFADWWYLRTHTKLTCPSGEKAFQAFLDGCLIVTRSGDVNKLVGYEEI